MEISPSSFSRYQIAFCMSMAWAVVVMGIRPVRNAEYRYAVWGLRMSPPYGPAGSSGQRPLP